MGFIGVQPASVPLTASDITNDIINADKIADNSISEEHLDPTIITGLSELAEAPASTDEFLISDGGTLKRLDASYVGGGELVFINKNISTSGGTYATMDNVFSSTYQNYVAYIGLSTSVENDVFFNFRVGASGSTSLSEDTSYKYAAVHGNSNASSSTYNYGNNGDKAQITHGSNANDNRLSAFTGVMHFFTPYSTSFFARATMNYFYQNASGYLRGGSGGILYGYTTAEKTGFSFYTSGGNMDEINIRVYGIKDN